VSWGRRGDSGHIPGLCGKPVRFAPCNITDLIESDTTPIQVDTSTAELQVLGFALVGIFVLVEGVGCINLGLAAFVFRHQALKRQSDSQHVK